MFLKKFCAKMDELKYKLCTVRNERFLTINLIMKKCRRCYNEKNDPKKSTLRKKHGSRCT
uniref:Uncharacterized protein n=1 Tax=Rhizophagus irregularis (strain DAOM 181602 / DAOM 197198 / MUCL 43194) TaxID=747089 RepID=U9TWI1_RHIID